MNDKCRIECVIKGEEYILRKVGYPSFILDRMKCPFTGKAFGAIELRVFVFKNYKDKCDTWRDVEKVTWYQGDKVLIEYDYRTKEVAKLFGSAI